MPQRPPGSGSGPDEPHYDWLYGGQQDAQGAGPSGARPPQPPPSDDPEPTRMMPAMQRPQPAGQGPGGPGRGGTTTATPPPRPAPQQVPKKRSKARTIRRVLLSVLVLWLVFLIAVPIWALSRIPKVDAAPAGARPAEQPGTTYLLVGSDSRKGLTAAQRKQLTTGDAAGQRTDTIMMLHVGSGPDTLISIPRDSLVPIPGHGTTKINAAFAYGGPKLLVKTIEQDTGVRIDHYVEIGFAGVANAVDAVGGITICPRRAIKDKDSGLNVKKGCQKIDGVTALAWSRDRHSFATGDIARARHQREVVAKVGAKVRSPWTLINPFRYFNVAKAGSDSLVVDKKMGTFALLRFAWAMSRTSGNSGKTCSMPISDLAVHWDRDRALALMKLIKEDRTADIKGDLCTKTGLP